MRHVTMTLRSCDFFGRVMINPQEVMMALSPEERLTHAHTQTQSERFGDERPAMSNADLKVLFFFLY